VNTKTFVERHPLLTYFFLAYSIAWCGALLVAGAKSFDISHIQPLDIGMMYLLMLLGPSVSGLLLTAILDGRSGLANLFARIRKWQVEAVWYSLALLLMPLAMLGVLMALTLFVSPAYRPGFAPIGLVLPLFTGFIEEIGWTGFATPRLQAKHNLFYAGFLLGIMWAVWHLVVSYFGSAHSLGAYWLTDFVISWLLTLIPYRILMGWVYKNTESIWLAQLMHLVFSASLGLFSPAVSAVDALVWHAALMVILWLLVAIIFISHRMLSNSLGHIGKMHRDSLRHFWATIEGAYPEPTL
jgi:membrane protease YdiL (CAAX protease family)